MSNTRRATGKPRRPVKANSGEGREIGLDDREIPGGLTHVSNPETHVAGSPHKATRHVKMDVEHGVPDPNPDAPYALPEAGKEIKPEPVKLPEIDLAVPVYIVEQAEETKYVRTFVSGGPVTLVPGDTARVAVRDPHRTCLYVANETTGNILRVGTESDTDQGNGLAVFGGTREKFVTQDELFVLNVAASNTTISWGYETDIPAVGD